MGSLPDQVYLDEIPKLRSYPNIRTLGYVATHYADKPIENVLAEIDTYAKWPKVSNITKLRVDGIFLDETPSTYDAGEYEYLQAASRAVRNATTFKDRFVGMYLLLRSMRSRCSAKLRDASAYTYLQQRKTLV